MRRQFHLNLKNIHRWMVDGQMRCCKEWGQLIISDGNSLSL